MHVIAYIDHIGDVHVQATAQNLPAAKWFVAFTEGVEKEAIDWEDDLEHSDRIFYVTEDLIWTIEAVKHIS